jgi:hypothetical protein
VTLHEPGVALSGNYLKVQLARAAEPNRLMDVEIGGVTEGGTEGGGRPCPRFSADGS